MSAAARRRRAGLAAIAAAAAVAGAIVGAQARDPGPEPTTTTTSAPAPACPQDVAADDRRLVGRMLVVRMEATATPALRAAARRGELGGVILFPPEGTDPADLEAEIARLRRAAVRAGREPPLVMIDQEGGLVQRLPSLAPELAPTEMTSRRAARRAGRATGRDLVGIGVDVDLAPVLDVPTTPSSAIAARAFGDDPETVTARGLAFAGAMQRAGVAATAKHFPGIGSATVNTDEAPVLITASRRELAPGVRPFAAAIDADVGMVMVANATFRAYDPRRPASLSRRVVDGLLRSRLGFGGAVITDDLGAGAITAAGFDEGEAALAAARAGADQLLFAITEGSEARRSLLRALRSGRLRRDELVASCARTTALRERFGVSAAGP